MCSTADGFTPWETYVGEPSPANARQVERISFSNADEDDYWSGLLVLRIQVFAGDADAFKLTLRLLKQSDGALLEDLAQISGLSIRVQPRQFLVGVAAEELPKRLLETIRNAAGEEYVDKPKARLYEMQMRRETLESIGDPSLQTIRDLCLSLLADRDGM
ncbi:MAG: hypothetical protein AAF680_00240 [Pseudomonadota bacterium]